MPAISPANSAVKPRAKESAASCPVMRPMTRNRETSTAERPRYPAKHDGPLSGTPKSASTGTNRKPAIMSSTASR